jgi:hypothetical protein
MSKPRTLKITAHELADFMNHGWPTPEADWFYDDYDVDLWESTFKEGSDAQARLTPLEPARVINLYDFEASIFYQRKEKDPTAGEGYSLTTLFLKWRSAKSTKTVVVEVPNSEFAKLEGLVEKMKGRIVA